MDRDVRFGGRMQGPRPVCAVRDRMHLRCAAIALHPLAGRQADQVDRFIRGSGPIHLPPCNNVHDYGLRSGFCMYINCTLYMHAFESGSCRYLYPSIPCMHVQLLNLSQYPDRSSGRIHGYPIHTHDVGYFRSMLLPGNMLPWSMFSRAYAETAC